MTKLAIAILVNKLAGFLGGIAALVFGILMVASQDDVPTILSGLALIVIGGAIVTCSFIALGVPG